MQRMEATYKGSIMQPTNTEKGGDGKIKEG
jgi:hypothetical protein